jgi:cob(I)alamin adenosyltransferase
MSIYTRRGDEGDTSLAGGARVSKASARLEACGALDEAAAFVGLARSGVQQPLLRDLLDFVAHRLTACAAILSGAEASAGESALLSAGDVSALEMAIDRFEQHTGPLKGFIALKGSESAARLHVARTVVRRAERRVVAVHDSEPVDPSVLAFLNRCSDALFAAARFANQADGFPEQPWNPDAKPPVF